MISKLLMKEKIGIHFINGKSNLKKSVTLISNDIDKIDFLVVFLDSDGKYDLTLSMIKNFYKSLIGIIQNCIEEFIVDCIKSTEYGNRVLKCIEEYISCVLQNGWKDNFGCIFYKSIIYSYIAIMEDPEKRLGEAFHAGYFPFQGEKIQVIKKLLERPLRRILY
ncbi:MAG: hypothetical protein RMJ36_04695 [Candidatus Calescibacterium sp.]|nr:hypothetical protein [Candidatus Calescibacterium sp.]MDW8132932.1 hypothetical protein [Candidatus Calescibacterium sp.]